MVATCGNCNASVNQNDSICPKCGALLAAYASPVGSVTTAPEYSTPSYAKPPVVTEVIPPVSAPEPLFDTHITVEDLATAAELDSPVELLLADTKLPELPEKQTPVPQIAAEEADEPEGYPWPEPEMDTNNGKPGPPIEVDSVPTGRGETEDYLRKLHKRAGYKASTSALSAPVTSGRPTPADRAANREARDSVHRKQPAVTPVQIPGATRVLGIIVIVFWAGVLLSALAGKASIPMIIFTVVLTMWAKMMNDKGKR